jgi:hypothetical protein
MKHGCPITAFGHDEKKTIFMLLCEAVAHIDSGQAGMTDCNFTIYQGIHHFIS